MNLLHRHRLDRTAILILAWLVLSPAASVSAWSQTVPEGRVITHREQSLKPYDPVSAEELFKHIKVPPAPALTPAVAERLISSAASLAGAAAELRRRAALADVSRRVSAVRASRRRLSSAAEGVQRELDAIADEVAEAVTVSFFGFFFLSATLDLDLRTRPPSFFF